MFAPMHSQPASQMHKPTHSKPKKHPGTAKFKPEDYGAVGDGVTDDTQAFRDMHDAIMAKQTEKPGVHIIIEFAPDAIYNYTWNEWSWGIEYLTLEGNNASIRNTEGGHWLAAHSWRTNAPIAGSWEDTTVGELGFLIDTAEAGSTSVTLKDIANASEFTVGEWVLVASYSQQEMGWPPNTRCFDYAKVTSINGATVNLDRPLEDTHRDNFPTRGDDDEIDVATLIPAERNSQWSEKWLVKDLTVLPNPNWGDGGGVAIEGFNEIVMDNVDIFQYVAGQGKKLVFKNSNLPDAEPDKLLEELTYENSYGNLWNATGVDTLNFINSESDWFYFAGRHLNIDGSTFSHDTNGERQWDPITMGGPWTVETVKITNSTINGTDPNGWNPPIKTGWSISQELGAAGITLDGDDVIISYPEAFEGLGIINRLYEGQQLRVEDANHNFLGTGTIEAITSNGAPMTARLDIDWSLTPQDGMVLVQYNIASLVGENVVLNDTSLGAWDQSAAYMEWNGVVLNDFLVE